MNPLETKEEGLPCDLALFWRGEEIPQNLLENVSIPPLEGAILKRLGNFPLGKGSKKIVDSLLPIYQKAAKVQEWI
ncbi:MAG: hypothetical protein HUU50_10995 [Candidatus Brocadiae bacterium]|nr:hypothetical protein [Candidatus Brocadiia bacterium]